MSHQVRVWDLPTRIFHWALVVGVLGLAITGQIGGAAMSWHFRFGYAVLALLLFRLIWGFIGGHWSRFASFFPSPLRLWHSLRQRGGSDLAIGHSPLGSLSVFAMLFFLLAQVATGLISDDEISWSGPLTSLVSNSWVSWASSYHRSVGKFILLVLVLLHVAAIGYYVWHKRQNLVRAMLLGDKVTAIVSAPHSRDDGYSRAIAVAVFLTCVAGVVLMLYLAP